MTTPIAQLREIQADLERIQPSIAQAGADSLAVLLPILEAASTADAAPGAMRTLASRLAGVVAGLSGPESIRPEEELSKLAQGVEKLARSMGEVQDAPPVAADPAPVPAAVQAPPPASATDAEGLDLVRRFVDRQRGDLEEFEVALLEREKGSAAGDQHVRRYLHTLKGEFGVLELGRWSELIHEVETALEEHRIGTEGLLKLKDLINDRLSSFLTPFGAEISAGERNVVFGVSAAAVAESALPTTDFAGDPSFLVDFIAEGGDHIHNIEKALLKLETMPTDDESINMVFRSCHTLKGLAGFLELHDIQSLAHAAESLMDRARNHLITLGPQHVDVLLETTDAFRHLVDSLEKKVVGGGESPAPDNLELLVQRLRDADNLPPMAPLPPEKAGEKLGVLLVDKGVAPEAVEKALKTQQEGDERPLGEILITSGDASVRDVGQLLGQQTQAKRSAQPTAVAVEETIRVPVQRLDLLIDAIGEAVIAQSMVWADPRIEAVGDLGTEKKIAQASLMLRQIQELSMSLRMVGIRSTFQKMSRLVRDLARKLDKQIELSMEGEETELDKTVVENIGDPLVHMVRNSLDHGVETPSERIASGKPAQGHVKLRAFHKAGSVWIEIEDDGRGLDREAILRKAIASGSARPEQSYSDAEVHQMIFLPGLSTAKAVTDVSGRGVGMDVVKKNIEALRGTVEIRSEKGRGTCFSIRLPLTLAIIQGMVVRIGTERYIVPTLSILTTLSFAAAGIQTVVGRGEVIQLRGDLVRLIRLSEVFSGPAARRAEQEDGVVLVVEDVVGRRIGVLVDQILEQQQVVIKNIGGGMGNIAGVAGGAIMSDGSVSLIIDVAGVVKLASE